MKDRQILMNNIFLMITEHLLLLPLVLYLLILSGWNGLLMFFVPVIAFSALLVFIWSFFSLKLCLVISAAIFAANTLVLILAADTIMGTLLALVMGTGFLVRSIFVVRSSDISFSYITILIMGIAFYFLSAFVFNYYELLQPYTTFLAVAAGVTVVTVFFTLNQSLFGSERRVASKMVMVSKTTRSTNLLLLILFCILVLIISALSFTDHIWAFLLWILNSIINLIESISRWYHSLFEMKTPELIHGISPPMAPHQEYSSVINKIGYYFGLVVIFLGIALSLYIVIKKTLKFTIKMLVGYYRMLVKRRDSRDMATKEYEDKITSLLKEGESAWAAARRWLSSRRVYERPYRLLRSNAERVRWIYKQSVKKALSKGMPLNQAMTSTEVLRSIGQAENMPTDTTKTAMEAYNSARYGAKEPADFEIERMKAFYSSKSPRV